MHLTDPQAEQFPDKRRLALITWTAKVGGEQTIGTGYFVTRDLVLTAGHVAPEDKQVRIRIERGQPIWRDGEVVWRDALLDAALIHAKEALPDGLPAVNWGGDLPTANVGWTSTGYPKASITVSDKGEVTIGTAGLKGN